MKKILLFLAALLPLLMMAEEVPVQLPPVPPPPEWTLEQFVADQDGFYQAWKEYLQKLPAYAKEVEHLLPEEKRSELATLLASNYQVTLRENNKYFPISANFLLFGKPYKFNADQYLNELFNYPYNPKKINGLSVIISVYEPKSTSKTGITIEGVAIFSEKFSLRGNIRTIYLPSKTTNILLSVYLPYYLCYDVYGISLGTSNSNVYGLDISWFTGINNTMNGLQISPLANYTNILNGLQISLFNETRATNFLGLQIGLLNNNGRIWMPLINVVY